MMVFFVNSFAFTLILTHGHAIVVYAHSCAFLAENSMFCFQGQEVFFLNSNSFKRKKKFQNTMEFIISYESLGEYGPTSRLL